MENKIPRFPKILLPEELRGTWDAVWGGPHSVLSEREHYDSVARLLKLKIHLETAWSLWEKTHSPGQIHSAFVPVDPDQASYPKWNAIIELERLVLDLEKHLGISPNVLGEHMPNAEKSGLSMRQR